MGQEEVLMLFSIKKMAVKVVELIFYFLVLASCGIGLVLLLFLIGSAALAVYVGLI
jgi:hypothetical protein